MKGNDFVNEMLSEWESIVNTVEKSKIRDKMSVCGRAAIKLRRELV